MAAVAEADVEAVAEAADGVEDGAVAVVGVAGSKRLALSRRFLRLFRKAPRATSFLPRNLRCSLQGNGPPLTRPSRARS